MFLNLLYFLYIIISSKKNIDKIFIMISGNKGPLTRAAGNNESNSN